MSASTPTPAKAVIHHEDIGAAVYAAIPPRRVPLGKRLFWRLVLLLLRSPRGRDWIASRYGARGG